MAKQSWSRKHLLPTLIGIAVCYSLAFSAVQYYILTTHVHSKIYDDAECSALPGIESDDLPHCSEVRLFRDWHSAESEPLEPDDAELLAKSPQEEPMHSMFLAVSPIHPAGHQETQSKDTAAFRAQADGKAVDDANEFAREFGMLVDQGQDHKAELEQEKQTTLRHKRFDEIEKEVSESLSHSSMTPWAADLMEQEKRLEDELDSDDSRHKAVYQAGDSDADERKQLLEWQAQVDKLSAAIHAALHSNTDAPWASELTVLRHRLELQTSVHMMHSHIHKEIVSELKHTQLDKLEEALHSAPDPHFKTRWDKLGSTTFEIQQMRVHLNFQTSSRMLAEHASLHQLTPPGPAAAHSHDEELEKHSKRMNKQIAQKMTDLERGLADLVSERDANVKQASTVKAPASTAVGFMEKRLQWSAVTALSETIVFGGASHAQSSVLKSDVRHLKWAGSLPTVACITPITYSRHTMHRMMYFIDNFKLQDYEGSKQLLLVYHYLDTEAAELVKKYADAVNIKGVASRGSEDFPSNAALRYAAWSAHVDVIARWEFDDYHDPSRLSMQVRTMAYTSRPACVLDQVRVIAEDELVKEATLVGERSWMKAYWQPLVGEVTMDQVSPPAAHVAQLNLAPHLANQIQQVSLMPKEITESPSVHEWTLKECLDLDSSAQFDGPKLALTPETEAAVDKSLGHNMGKIFHKLMARRHDITQKLQLLCMETTMESDMQEHIVKRTQVEQMVAIRSELDSHIEATVALFTNPSS